MCADMRYIIWFKQNKILIIANASVLLCMAIAWTLYCLFGHQIITTIYNGQSIEFLNGFIGKQNIRSVGEYFQIADKMMWDSTLKAIISVIILNVLIKIITIFIEPIFRFLKFISDFSLRQKMTTDFFCALFIAGLLYRGKLYYSLLTDPFPPFGFEGGPYTIMSFLAYPIYDLISAVIISSLALVIYFVSRSIPAKGIMKIHNSISIVLLSLLILFTGVICGIHYRLMFSMYGGVTYEILSANIKSLSGGDILDFLYWGDVIIFILAPVAIFWLFNGLPQTYILWRNRCAALLTLIVVILSFAPDKQASYPEIKESPLLFMLTDFLAPYRGSEYSFGKMEKYPSKAQMVSLALVDPSFAYEANQAVPIRAINDGAGRQWNLVFIIMESAGLDYAFNPVQLNRIPMPFLHQISRRGLFLQNHFASANSSPRALFSIFSGIYEMPTRAMFSVRPDAYIPIVSRFLGSNYESFLVTPGWLSSFFPKRFFENNGLTEMYGFSELPSTYKVLGASRHKNEVDTVGFFLDRVNSAREPFFAVYYSYAAHHPYYDYGERYHLLTDVKNDTNRYYNNLFFLDIQFERILNSLEVTGLMNNTIVIVVGDHGQAFGQHEGIWRHGTSSFNEEFRAPVIFYQPKLFPPKVISALTSHVDILPTILEAMGIRYNRSLFQGESILQETFNRKYIFLINHGGTISSISKEKIKLTISYSQDRCWVYDLHRDPLEREKLDCHKHEEQMIALLSFRKYQQDILVRYNLSQKREEGFFGEKHPGIKSPFPHP